MEKQQAEADKKLAEERARNTVTEAVDENGNEISHKNPSMDYDQAWEGISSSDVAFV